MNKSQREIINTYNEETGNNLGKFCYSASNTFESEFGHDDQFQIFEGISEKDNNFLEKGNDKVTVDVLGTPFDVDSSICDNIELEYLKKNNRNMTD